MWFLAPYRLYRVNKSIDVFIYKLIKEIENGAKFYATKNGAFVYNIELKDDKYTLWGDNRYFGYLSNASKNESSCFGNLWRDQLPSRRCCWDFLMTANKYCIEPETTDYKDETTKILADLP